MIDRSRTFFDADSAGIVMGETFRKRLFTFFAWALDQIMRGDADNALINVIVDCTGAERARDAVSDEYFAGGVRRVL